MKHFHCISNTLAHSHGSCDKVKPSNPWVFNQIPDSDDEPVVYVDNMISQAFKMPAKKDFGWMCESPAIIDSLSEWITINISHVEKRFTKIFTCDRSLLPISEVFEWAPAGSNMPWIENIEMRDEKDKLVSIIASGKKTTQGHILRHEIVEKNDGAVDVFGRGYTPIDKKEEGLERYMFSYCIENTKADLYYTEKIADAIACGTIPIYWGSDQISEVFDDRGIIRYEDLGFVELSEGLYNEMKPYAEENLNRLKEMKSADDIVQQRIVEILNG
jgi:hypothetical protein